MPAKLLEVNRQILNNQLARTGARQGELHPPHRVRGRCRRVADFPALNSGVRRRRTASPSVVRHEHVNLGLAVDVEAPRRHALAARAEHQGRRRARLRRLLAGVRGAHRARCATGKISPDDFAGTTGTITNPGMIGTVHSVPRLMPGQGFILGVGAIGYPAEYEGADPHTLAQLGVSKVTTLTNTYDHRIITGAESGEFLRADPRPAARRRRLLRRRLRAASRCRTSRRAGAPTAARSPTRRRRTRRSSRSTRSINMYRVRGHLIANLDPLGRREPHTHPELDITHYDLSHLGPRPRVPGRRASAPGTLGRDVMPLRDILGVLRDAYARTVGVEYMHIQEPDQKDWIQERVEAPPPAVTPEEQAPHPRAAERGRGVRALPAHEVPRAEALQPRGRGDAHPDARRAAAAQAADAGHDRGRARHGAPRPAQRARQRGRQVVRADLPRVRGRARPRRACRARAT